MSEDTSAFQTWPPVAPQPDGASGVKAGRQVEVYPTPKLAAGYGNDETALLEGGGGAVAPGGAGAGTVFSAPDDRGQMAFGSFVLIGFGLLAPWNSILSSSDYFGSGAIFNMSVAYQTANVLGLIAVVRYGSRYTFRSRVIPGFAVYILALVLLLVLKTSFWRIFLAGVLGLVDAIVQGSIFSLSAMLGPRYVSSVMIGQGVAGVGVSVLHIITKASIDQDDAGIREATVIFFGLACGVVALSMVVYLAVLERSPVTKYFLDRPARIRDAKFERQLLSSRPDAYTTLAPGAYHNMSHQLRDAQSETDRLIADEEAMFNGPPVSTAEVWSKVWPMGIAVAFIFTITLACFPGLTVELKSTSEHLNSTGWYVVVMVTLFDVGDLVGRSMPSVPFFANLIGDTALYIGSALRAVFLPSFILAVKNKVFTNDPLQYLLVWLFSVSNGYFSTLVMMRAPDRVALHERELAGTVMVFALTFGLTGGVWLGFGIGKVI